MELTNSLRDVAIRSKKIDKDIDCAEWQEALEVLAKLIAPFAPHLAEEIWVEQIGKKFSVHKSPWPTWDNNLVKKDSVVIVVQVDGKVRSQFVVTNWEKQDIVKAAQKDPKVVKWLETKKIKKVIFVAGKLVNFVTT